jgi:hypothetical protein
MQMVWFPYQKYLKLTDIRPAYDQLLQKDAKQRKRTPAKKSFYMQALKRTDSTAGKCMTKTTHKHERKASSQYHLAISI